MKHRARMAFLLLTVLIDTMGISIVMPVMPRLLESMSHLGANTVVREGGLLLSIYALAQFFTSPILGSISDRVGRRPILLIALLAYAIDYVCMGFAPNVAWLFLGRLIAGVAGATMVTINAYAADVTQPEERTKAFGLIGATFGIGFITGPMIGGALATISVRAPFFGAAALAFMNVLYGFFVLPESLPREKRTKAIPAQAHPLQSILEMAQRPHLYTLLLAYFFQQLAFSVFPSTWTYYCAWRFDWSPALIGVSLACSGILMAAVQGVLVNHAVKRFGARRTIICSAALSCLVFCGYGAANQTWMMFAFMLCGAAMFFMTPALTALLSQRISAVEQGTLQGILAAILGITMMIGPLLATQIFAAFSARNAVIHLPGAAFFFASCMMGVAGCIAWFATKQYVFRTNDRIASLVQTVSWEGTAGTKESVIAP